MCTARSEGYRARAREKNSWKKQGRCKGHGGSYGGGRGRGRGWVAVSKERGWISNMLRQMRRPTVVCHSFSLVSLLFLSSAACFPIFPSLSRPARSAFKHPPPPSLYSDLLALSPFFPPRNYSFQRVACPARVHVLSSYSAATLALDLKGGNLTSRLPVVPPFYFFYSIPKRPLVAKRWHEEPRAIRRIAYDVFAGPKNNGITRSTRATGRKGSSNDPAGESNLFIAFHWKRCSFWKTFTACASLSGYPLLNIELGIR